MRQQKSGLIVLFLIISDLSGPAVGLEYLLTRRGNALNQELPVRNLPFLEQLNPLNQRLATFDAFEIELPESILEDRVKHLTEKSQEGGQRLASRDRVEVKWHYQDRYNTNGANREIRRVRWAPAQNPSANMEKEQALPATATGSPANALSIPDLLVSLLLIFICVLLIVQNRRMKYTSEFTSKSP